MTRRGRPPVADGVGGRARRPSPPAAAEPRARRRLAARWSDRACRLDSRARERLRRERRPSAAAGRNQPPAEEPPSAAAEPGAARGPPPPRHPQHELPDPVDQDNPGAVRAPPPEAFPTDQIPIPDRWRLIETLGVVQRALVRSLQPEHLKGDRPLCLPTDEEQERRREAGIAALRDAALPRPHERRLVLRRQRHLRHGDRAAHLPDPGRRADHRRARAASTCSAATTASSSSQTFIAGAVADQGLDRLHAAAHRVPR